MHSSDKMEDKAISTEDFSDPPFHGISQFEVARLEAVISTLLENKVEAMKCDHPPANKTTANSHHSSPKNGHNQRSRITSSSTMSSSHHHKHHHHHQQQHHITSKHHGRRKHNTDQSAEDSTADERKRRYRRDHHRHHRPSSLSPESPRRTATALTDENVEALGFLQYETAACSSSRSERCCCYTTMKNGQIKLQCELDYISLNIEDFDEDSKEAAFRRARRKRRRRKRRKKQQQLAAGKFVQVQPMVEHVKLIDPDDLPQRARWTIVITACLLLLMCLLLVGATLRMAPIIDDIVRKENEELMNSLHRESVDYTNATSDLESS